MPAPTISRSQLWTARVLTAFAVLFLVFDASMKLLQLAPAIQGTTELGFPAGSVFGIGLLELACIALYVIPRSSFVGAVLLTGYFGGAIASQVRVGNPLLSHVLFPTYVAAMIWAGLYLRDGRLRALVLIPTRAQA